MIKISIYRTKSLTVQKQDKMSAFGFRLHQSSQFEFEIKDGRQNWNSLNLKLKMAAKIGRVPILAAIFNFKFKLGPLKGDFQFLFRHLI